MAGVRLHNQPFSVPKKLPQTQSPCSFRNCASSSSSIARIRTFSRPKSLSSSGKRTGSRLYKVQIRCYPHAVQIVVVLHSSVTLPSRMQSSLSQYFKTPFLWVISRQVGLGSNARSPCNTATSVASSRRRGGLIQDQKRCSPQKGSGNGDPLRLSFRQAMPSFPDDGIQPLRQ